MATATNVSIVRSKEGIILSFNMPQGGNRFSLDLIEKGKPDSKNRWAYAVNKVDRPEIVLNLSSLMKDDGFYPETGEYQIRIDPLNGGVPFDRATVEVTISQDDLLTYGLLKPIAPEQKAPPAAKPATEEKEHTNGSILARTDKNGRENPNGLSLRIQVDPAVVESVIVVGRNANGKSVFLQRELFVRDSDNGVFIGGIRELLTPGGTPLNPNGEDIYFTVITSGRSMPRESEIKFSLTKAQVDILLAPQRNEQKKTEVEARITAVEAKIRELSSTAATKADVAAEISKLSLELKGLREELGRGMKALTDEIVGNLRPLTASVIEMNRLSLMLVKEKVEVPTTETTPASDPTPTPAPVQPTPVTTPTAPVQPPPVVVTPPPVLPPASTKKSKGERFLSHWLTAMFLVSFIVVLAMVAITLGLGFFHVTPAAAASQSHVVATAPTPPAPVPPTNAVSPSGSTVNVDVHVGDTVQFRRVALPIVYGPPAPPAPDATTPAPAATPTPAPAAPSPKAVQPPPVKASRPTAPARTLPDLCPPPDEQRLYGPTTSYVPAPPPTVVYERPVIQTGYPYPQPRMVVYRDYGSYYGNHGHGEYDYGWNWSNPVSFVAGAALGYVVGHNRGHGTTVVNNYRQPVVRGWGGYHHPTPNVQPHFQGPGPAYRGPSGPAGGGGHSGFGPGPSGHGRR